MQGGRIEPPSWGKLGGKGSVSMGMTPEEYQQYVKTVPIMVPFIPLYSVEKYKWLVA